MPNLVLTSSFSAVADRLLAEGLIPLPGASVAFVPTAATPYPEHPWLDADRAALVRLGYRVTDVPFEDQGAETLREALSRFDVIFVAGGLVTYLAEQSRRSGFDGIVRGLLRDGKRYVGSSAGSMILGPTVSPFLEEERAELPPGFVLGNLECANLVDFIVLPHDQVPEFAAQHDAIVANDKTGHAFVRLTDAEYRVESV